MKKEFLFNIVFLLAINLLIKPFYIFGIDRSVQNLAGKEAYGLYFALFSFTLLFQITADLGTTNFNNRLISRHPHFASKYFSTMLTLRGIMGIAYMIVVLCAAAWIYGLSVYPLVIWIALNQFLNALILFLRSNIAGLALYRTDSMISVIDKVLMIVFCSILLWTEPFRQHFKIEWFIWCQSFTLSVTALASWIIILRKTGRLQFKFNLPLWISVIRSSFPFALVIFLMTFYTRMDAVLLERLIPDGQIQAGIYASAYRLLDASNMIGYLFAGLLLPMFSRLLKAREQEGVSLELVDFSFRLLLSGAITAAVAVYFHRTEIMAVLYEGEAIYPGRVMSVLMMSFVAMCTIYIYGTLLTAHGDLRQMNQLFLAAIILNITLNIALIPRFQALGAAWATCLTQCFVAVGQWWLAHRLLKMEIRYKDLLKLAVFSGLLMVVAYMITLLPGTGWFWQFAGAIASGVILAFATGLLSWSGLRNWWPQ